MKNSNSRIAILIKKCWKEISFKDKGLILIMIILLLQCIHNLYNPNSNTIDYASINVIVRTSVAGIFGYFLSANFLVKATNKEDIEEEEEFYKLSVLQHVLKDEEAINKIRSESKIYDEEKIMRKEKDRYFCNKTLQNAIAIGICIVIILCLVIGVNGNLIPEGAGTTISQFRDLISGCIGFLLGNSPKKDGK